MSLPTSFRVQAKTVWPDAANYIDNGVVTVVNGLIVGLERSNKISPNVIDLGDVDLIPGLVNAHTHLEFSSISQPLGFPGIKFTDWLKLVIKKRSTQTTKSDAIRNGIAESISGGVSVIGEIATPPVNDFDYETETLNFVCFMESLSRNPKRTGIVENQSLNWVEQNQQRSFTPAISPHAPYSVHPQLFENLVRQSQQFNTPVAIHLAETLEEIQLLREQSGPFVDFLQDIGAWYPSSFSTFTGVLDWLHTLSKAPRSLVIHGNYLERADIEFIQTVSDRMSVVFCPRTHKFFGHLNYPLETLLDAGINVAIGTDSRASNPDLNLFDELKAVRSRYPQISDSQILKMGTSNGAKALGFESAELSLAVGNPAVINVVDRRGTTDMFGEASRCIPLKKVLNNAS